MSSDSGNASPAGGSVVAAAAASSPVAAAAASSFSSPSPSPPPSASPSSVVLAVFSEPRASAQAAAETAREEASHPQKEEELLWYFAIGSMCNLTSMNLRNLFPKQSLPGVLKGWKLVFRGSGGMGDIDPCEDPEDPGFHGVLHQLTHAEFKHLDEIESIYERVPVKVDTYDGRVIDAFAYKMSSERLARFGPQVDALPGERYIDIICRGCRHFGVKEEYVTKLAQVPTMPRKKPEEYRCVPTPPPVVISKAELAAGTGALPFDPAKPLLVAINGKVLRWARAPEGNQQMSYEWTQKRFGGQDCTVMVCKTLYEPIYPIPTCFEEMPPDCRRWSEELMVGMALRGMAHHHDDKDNKIIGNYEVIGWLEGHEPEEVRKQIEQQQQQSQQQQSSQQEQPRQ